MRGRGKPWTKRERTESGEDGRLGGVNCNVINRKVRENRWVRERDTLRNDRKKGRKKR